MAGGLLTNVIRQHHYRTLRGIQPLKVGLSLHDYIGRLTKQRVLRHFRWRFVGFLHPHQPKHILTTST